MEQTDLANLTEPPPEPGPIPRAAAVLRERRAGSHRNELVAPLRAELTAALGGVAAAAAAVAAAASDARAAARRDHDRAMARIRRSGRSRRSAAAVRADASRQTLAGNLELACQSSGPYASAPFDDDVWDQLHPAASHPQLVRFGTMRVTDRYGATNTVAALPVIGTTIVVEHEPGGVDIAQRVAEILAVRTLAASPPGGTQLQLMDGATLGAGLGVLARVPHTLSGGTIATEPASIAALIDGLAQHTTRLVQHVLGAHESLMRRWASGDFDEPARLVVAAGLPHGIDRASFQRLTSVVRASRRSGIGQILLVDTTDTPPDMDFSQLPADVRLRVHGDTVELLEPQLAVTGTSFEFSVDPGPGQRQVDLLTGELGPAAADGRSAPIRLSTTLSDDRSDDATERVTFHLGRGEDGTWVQRSIGTGGADAVGALVVGASNSGKSTLLHSIVHEIAARYEPGDVELWLADLKDGVEFTEYVHSTNNPGLRHARHVTVSADPFGMAATMRALAAETTRRYQLFADEAAARGATVKSISDYRRATGEQLPRIVAVVDEFQRMFSPETDQDLWPALDLIVRQGRAAGVHLLLATQSLDNIAVGRKTTDLASFLKELHLRVALGVDDRGQLTELLGVAPARTERGPIGTAHVRQLNSDPAPVRLRTAILDPDERRQIRQLSRPHSSTPQRVRRGEGAKVLDAAEALSAAATPVFTLGLPVSPDADGCHLELVAAPGRGLAYVSPNRGGAIGAMLAGLCGLELHHHDVEPVVLDLERSCDAGLLAQVDAVFGGRLRVVTGDDPDDVAAALHSTPSGATAAVVVLGVAEDPASRQLLGELFAHGPARGQFPLWWVSRPEHLTAAHRDHLDDLAVRAADGVGYNDITSRVFTAAKRVRFDAPRRRTWWVDLSGGEPPELLDLFCAPDKSLVAHVTGDAGAHSGQRAAEEVPA